MWKRSLLGSCDAARNRGSAFDVLVWQRAREDEREKKTVGIQKRKRGHQVGQQVHHSVPCHLLRLRHRSGGSRYCCGHDSVAHFARTGHDPCCGCCDQWLCGSVHQQLHQVRMRSFFSVKSICEKHNTFSPACSFLSLDTSLHLTASRAFNALLQSAPPPPPTPMMFMVTFSCSCCVTGFVGAFVGNSIISYYIQKYKKT
jgi:hypothetical protein